MSTPTTLKTYRVTWLAGDGDGSVVHTHTVQAATSEINTSFGFLFFMDADGITVYSISLSFLVSVELVTEKD